MDKSSVSNFMNLAKQAWLEWLCLAVFAAACSSNGVPSADKAAVKPMPADQYDRSTMDLVPRPSKTSTDVPAMPAPNAGTTNAPAMSPLEPYAGKPVTRDVRIDVTNQIVEVAPGVKFAAWTFGDTVPGPTVRARVGDLVRFTMTNRGAETVNGVQVGVPMPHSMDFHAAMVSPQDKYHSILPGETITFEFTANYPGVFMYHCGTPMILEHLVAGMYGMTVVEPREGYPTRVDREYAIVQSEFYLKPGDKQSGLSVLDIDKARSKDATQVAFNGRALGMVEKPLVAKPGERVRLYFLNAGPSGTSSFHIVGTIFDRVWFEGNPDNQFRGMQTVLLGASNSVIVEFLIPEKGKYIIVDHEFADATKGAIGLIDATDGVTAQNGSTAPVQTDADKGKALFATNCAMCHVPANGAQRIAPDLAGVTTRRTDEWLSKWLMDTPGMLANDPAAKAMFAQWKVMMPPTGFTPEQVKQMIAYFHALDGGGAHDAH